MDELVQENAISTKDANRDITWDYLYLLNELLEGKVGWSKSREIFSLTTVTFELLPAGGVADPELPDLKVYFKPQSGDKQPYIPIILNAQNLRVDIQFVTSGEFANPYSLSDWCCFNTYETYSRGKLAVTFTDRSLGTTKLGEICLEGLADQVETEIVASETDVYDYYVWYAVSQPYSSYTSSNKYFVNGVEKFNKTIRGISGYFELLKVPNLKDGDRIKIQSSKISTDHKLTTEMIIIRRLNPFSVSISTSHNKLGDNTPLALVTNITGADGYYVEIFNTSTGKVYDRRSCTNYPNSITVNLGSDVGNLSIAARIVDSSGVQVKQSSSLQISKVNSLSGVLSLFYSNGYSGVYILVDNSRYFENNSINKILVSNIVTNKQPIYFVGNIVEASRALLEPLFLK